MGSFILVIFSFWVVVDMLQRVRSLREHIDTTIFNLQRSNHERRATQEALYRVAIETVQHVLLRSACKTLRVTLDQMQNADHVQVHLQIEDDCGLTADPLHLAAIREHVAAFGNMLRIDDTPEKFIRITASVIPAKQIIPSPSRAG